MGKLVIVIVLVIGLVVGLAGIHRSTGKATAHPAAAQVRLEIYPSPSFNTVGSL
jgi:F0F1-type ATP synthase assembly protein I